MSIIQANTERLDARCRVQSPSTSSGTETGRCWRRQQLQPVSCASAMPPWTTPEAMCAWCRIVTARLTPALPGTTSQLLLSCLCTVIGNDAFPQVVVPWCKFNSALSFPKHDFLLSNRLEVDEPELPPSAVADETQTLQDEAGDATQTEQLDCWVGDATQTEMQLAPDATQTEQQAAEDSTQTLLRSVLWLAVARGPHSTTGILNVTTFFCLRMPKHPNACQSSAANVYDTCRLKFGLQCV